MGLALRRLSKIAAGVALFAAGVGGRELARSERRCAKQVWPA